MKHRYILVLAMTVIVTGGCGRRSASDEEAQRSPPNVSVTTPGGHAEIRTGDRAMASLPGGLPAYPNADVHGSIDATGGSAQGQGRIVTFGTSDSPGQVINFYAQAAGRAGYAIANQMDMGATATLSARQSGGGALNIVATQTNGATQVQIVAAVATH